MKWNEIKQNDTVHLLVPEMVNDIFTYRYFVGTIYFLKTELEYGQKVMTVGISYDNEKFMFEIDEYEFNMSVVTVFGNNTIKFMHRPQIGDIFIAFDKNMLRCEYENMLDNEMEMMRIDIESLISRRNALKLLKEKEIFLEIS